MVSIASAREAAHVHPEPRLPRQELPLDPFVFVIALVAIMSVSRIVRTVVDRRALPSAEPVANPGEVEELRATLDNVMARVERLEEERDFFKDLLDAPKGGRELGPPPSGRPSPGA